LPAPPPIASGTQSSENSSEDLEIYNLNELFPKESYTYREAHGIDAETGTRVKYIIVNLFPTRFPPKNMKVTHAEEMPVTITYSESSQTLNSFVSLLDNLIITSPTLEPYALQLATWKNYTGISSVVVNTTWIYTHYGGVDNPEKIRNCIKDFVASHGIRYVTIFGDADQVPVRYAYVPDGYDTSIATDLYYSDLDGSWDDNHDGLYADQRYDSIDGIPDVYVG
jgi:hypothetical protein